MNDDTEYTKAIEQAKTNLSDAKKRGSNALGDSWDDLRLELLTPEEKAASNLRVAIMLGDIDADKTPAAV